MKERREFTATAVLLGCVLSVVMALANVYLGLKVGMTVSASIPSAVLSLIILRALRGSTIFENNMVQTAASAGESLAAGCIFTVPALLLLGYWDDIEYWPTFGMICLGGLLGVIFSIPFRRLFIIEQNLAFPEGIATAEILTSGYSGQDNRKSVMFLITAAVAAAFFKFAEACLGLWKDALHAASFVGTNNGGGWLLYGGTYLSPALLGVGYIVGANISLTIFLGGVVSWLLVLPLIVWQDPALITAEALADAVSFAHDVWSRQIRFLGVGAMVVGGIWTLFILRKTLVLSVMRGVTAIRGEANNTADPIGMDLPRTVLFGLLLGIAAFVTAGALSQGISVLVALIVVIIILCSAFVFSSVSGYMAGLVGSSNNPVSGVTVATVLVAGLILRFFLSDAPESAMFLTVSIAAFVCCAAAIAGDNLQDLKAGYLIGATPYKQQLMQIIGVVAAAFAIPWVLSLLHNTYVVGSEELVAPQATLVSGIVQGLLQGDLPWGLIIAGGTLAALVIAIDSHLVARQKKIRLPVLAFAVGIYLPLALSSAIALGGLLAYLQQRAVKAGGNERQKLSKQLGILFASGLITGEALMGVAVAALVSSNIQLNLGLSLQTAGAFAFLLLAVLMFYLPLGASRSAR